MSAVIGNILGYTVFEKCICAGMHYGSWSADGIGRGGMCAFLLTTVIGVLMFVINAVLIFKPSASHLC
ncbi:MAG: hypothetical protein ACLTZM_02525 [Ruminococcus sp.]